MEPLDIKTAAKIKKLATWYNQIPNVFWSILNFAPIGYFWYMATDLKWLYIILAISLSAGVLPNSFFDMVQLSQSTSFYEKIGMRTVKKFTQDGDLINRLLRRKFPQYKAFDQNASLQKHLAKAYGIEKIHFVMFLFFLLTGIYAFIQGRVGWAVVIISNNLVFNLYPNLLQQYNRLRLRQLMEKIPTKP